MLLNKSLQINFATLKTLQAPKTIPLVLDFLHFGNMVLDINYTHIVLIPRVKKSEKMADFRPISLCNVIYKIISKVLAN